MGLAVASLAAILVALVPLQARADGGAGIRFKTPTIYYSDDDKEDEGDTLESVPALTLSAYSAPVNFDFSFRPRYSFAND